MKENTERRNQAPSRGRRPGDAKPASNRGHHPPRQASAPKRPLPNNLRPRWLKKPPHEVDIVFFDLETTGGNPTNSMVIEIAAVKHSRGVEVARFETLINPHRRIPGIVQRMTGITQDMVKAAPSIEDVIEDFMNFLGDSVLVAHGAISDVAFIKHACREHVNKPFANYYLCTHLIVSNLMPDLPSKTLSGVAEHFGVTPKNAHRAMVDAELTRDVFLGLADYGASHGLVSTEDFLKVQGDQDTLRRLGPGLSPQEVESLPTTPGVFYLLNSHGEISYLSSTPNLKRALSTITELSTEREFNRLIVDVDDYKFERSSHFMSALLTENKELAKFHLAVDPRRLENRSKAFVQLLLPPDLLAFITENPDYSGLEIFGNSGRVSETVREFESLYAEQPALPPAPSERKSKRLGYADADLEEFLVQGNDAIPVGSPVRRTRIAYPSVAKAKYALSRAASDSRSGKSPHLQFGSLSHGVGWVFGPYDQPKEVQKEFQKLCDILPFHDTSLGFNRRLLYVRLLIGHLYERLGDEILALEKQQRTPRFLFSVSFRRTLTDTLRRLRELETVSIPRGREYLPHSGLAIVSNTDVKELDVAVVIRGRIRDVVRLPVEDSEKLQSKRFFTRLFCKYNDELMHDSSPLLFTEDVCSDVELFYHWKRFKNMEGDWVHFDDLSPLYDISLI